MDFKLDPVLARDTLPVATLGDCRLLLMDDSRFPWVILVPAIPGLRELFDLPTGRRGEVLDLACEVARRMADAFSADKMNIAALGNVVAQLHIHIIARHVGDDAWPAPVWGRGQAVAYTPDLRRERLARLRGCLDGLPEAPFASKGS